jgi:hypothetical protein
MSQKLIRAPLSTTSESINISQALRRHSVSKSARRKVKHSHFTEPRHFNTCGRCNYPHKMWGPTTVPVDREIAQTKKEHRLTKKFMQSVWPQHREPPATLAQMNTEETGIWVEMLARLKGWKEAQMYANNFIMNDVTGHVLPYLSVQGLRSELNIVKFGHRLEIITAIENSELTLMNPIIVSLRPIDFFGQPVTKPISSNCNLRSESNCSKWRNPCKKKLNKDTQEVSKCFFTRPKNPWHSANVINGGGKSESVLSGSDWISDADIGGQKIFEETSIWKASDSHNRSIGGSRSSSNNFKSRKSSGNYPWIPPIQLPPSMLQFDKNTSEEERFSTISADVKSGILTCGGQAFQLQENC